MQNKILNGGFIILMAALMSCEFIALRKNKADSDASNPPIARAGSAFLYKADIEGMVPKGSTAADSVNIIERYINNWIRKQLLITEAAEKIDFDQAEIERKMLDYRYALMVYEYKKYYVNNELSTTISDEELEAFYDANSSNFVLKQNIVRCLYIVLPENAPKLDQLRQLVRSDKPKDRDELKSYCFRFAESYSLEDSIWMNFDEVVSNSPLSGVPNKVQFLRENRFSESTSNGYIYLLRIIDYKISDQISPLEFVKDDIRNIIINKRKVALGSRLEDEVFNKAKRNNEFEIFR